MADNENGVLQECTDDKKCDNDEECVSDKECSVDEVDSNDKECSVDEVDPNDEECFDDEFSNEESENGKRRNKRAIIDPPLRTPMYYDHNGKLRKPFRIPQKNFR